MSQQVLLVNPARRKKRRTAAKKRRSTPRKRTTARRRRNPAPRTTARRAPRRAARRTSRTVARRRNPATVRSMWKNQVMPAAIGAGGALMADVAMGYLVPYLPTALQGSTARHITKGAVALGIGWIAESLKFGRDTAYDLARGGLTVVMHNAASEAMGTHFPDIPMAEYVSGRGMGYTNYALPAGGAGMSEYVSGGGMHGYQGSMANYDWQQH